MELTGHMNGRTGSWEVAMPTESVSMASEQASYSKRGILKFVFHQNLDDM